jgi:hypothetical protein
LPEQYTKQNFGRDCASLEVVASNCKSKLAAMRASPVKLGEEKSKYAGLAQENSFGSA